MLRSSIVVVVVYYSQQHSHYAVDTVDGNDWEFVQDCETKGNESLG